MKMQLNEVKRFQKIAGLLKEASKDEIKKGKSVIYTGPDKKYGEKTLKKGDKGVVAGFEEGEYTVDFENIGLKVLLSIKNLELNEKNLKEDEQTDKELYDLLQQFLPSFEDYVELYAIEVAEDQTGKYTTIEKDFAEQLKEVLFKLKKGVI